MTLGALSTITYYHIVLLINLSSLIQMSNKCCIKREAFIRKKTGIVWFVAQQEGRVAHANPTLVPIQVGGLVLGEP